MPWMLQPKSYTQIARPNLYNVAYRRVGAYKGMGRLHPTNYLQIGVRPNQIGATTGQYNTLSGQLSLLPPSLRGLAMRTYGARGLGQHPLSDVVSVTSNLETGTTPGGGVTLAYDPNAPTYVLSDFPLPGTAAAAAAAGAASTPAAPKPTVTNYIPWIIGAALFVVLLTGGRR